MRSNLEVTFPNMANDEKKDFMVSIVLIGKFQPGMFHPFWFWKNDVIAEDECKRITNDSEHPFVISNSFSNFQTDKYIFRISQERFEMTLNTKPYELIVDGFKKIFDSLSTIPITAYGINYIFRIEYDAKMMQKIGKKLAPRKYWGSFFDDEIEPMQDGLTQISMKRVEDFGAINLILQPSRNSNESGIIFNFNFHHEKVNQGEAFDVAYIESVIENQYSRYLPRVNKLTDEIIEKVTSYED